MRFLLLLPLLACVRGPGDTCKSSDQCTGGGACLKGVCSAYDCTLDEECGEGQTCGLVAGSQVCVQTCADDGDCAGEQTCGEVATSTEDTGGTSQICL